MPKQDERNPSANGGLRRENRPSNNNQKKPAAGNKKKGRGSTVFLTFLVVVLFVLIGAGITFYVWNSRPVNNATVAQQFYPKASKQAVANDTATSSSAATSSSSASTSDSASSSSSSSSSSSGNTYTVVAGDYPSLIASKTGLSWDDILKANPTLDPNNPGYYKNGSQLTSGQTLKLK